MNEKEQLKLVRTFIEECRASHIVIETMTDDDIDKILEHIALCECATQNREYYEFKVQQCQKIHQCDAKCDECLAHQKMYTDHRNNSVRGNVDDVF